MNISTVNELIQSLESAGELSIKERKYLEALKEFRLCSVSLDVAVKVANDFDRVIMECRKITGCPAGVDLQGHLQRLAAENVAMIRLLTDISDNHVEYFSEGEGYMFAGVPLDYVSEINMYVSRDVNAENPFPATDRIVAGIKADGAEACVRALVTSDDDDFADAPNICAMVAYQLREGADK